MLKLERAGVQFVVLMLCPIDLSTSAAECLLLGAECLSYAAGATSHWLECALADPIAESMSTTHLNRPHWSVAAVLVVCEVARARCSGPAALVATSYG